mmetsp:Transcript_25040/g.27760  ORF Transcript_25040/g.27760 Transcript_25040/m.27760 type:complete len:326 (-) Transcript_25040:286-1263(-)|eukprot:CAMPEP_0205825266 /NCGR_PEP_ID=MMETSP0206-20130828/24571_1 /ASSEMBLY_ACC=CAM_ASM_000279 /TAXON_ID=36767 /ORGANISM="Euplotes focardii, Strain TN1" /LENGTH=325 /DNA_ID=CAMNT_0053124167 /DNA_START=28 /DNA_END=1005 /DNA_ORIENTATION=+
MNLLGLALAVTVVAEYRSEYKDMGGKKNDYGLALPHTYLDMTNLPKQHSWCDVNGTSYCTKMLNQHLPQYCGSCWAHGAVSALADRIKIAREGKGLDINLAVQFILNCGSEAGSCYGGDHHAAYKFIKSAGFIPYDSCQPYLACSSDSKEGFCGHVDTKCSAMNTCRTCSTFNANGGSCVGLRHFPNASILEFGSVSGELKMQAEILARGPIACGINAEPILQYTGGVYDGLGESQQVNHVVSVVGWGTENGQNYWLVRNSWGEYWGEMGMFRLKRGGNRLGLEAECAWATPKAWTEKNFACYEDGSNCAVKTETSFYKDPSLGQ